MSLVKPSNFEKWLELLKDGLVTSEAEELLGCEVWTVDGLTTGGLRNIDDGPAWAPARSVRLVRIAHTFVERNLRRQRPEFDAWAKDHLTPEQLEEYEAACVADAVEREERHAAVNSDPDATGSVAWIRVHTKKAP